ncbi:MAG: hypothetical protein WD885_02720 [Candidatus Saccharimonadales bacterium]
MDEHFELFHQRIKLTKKQREDVKKKVNGVSRSLHDEFYGGNYDSAKKLIVGSHGKKTETRYPVGDIDLVFKINHDDLERYQAYDGNGPSALLTRVKEKLQSTYPNSEIHNWVKVVVIRFGDGQHDIEVIPCYENEDKTFTVPDTADGGTWPVVDYRREMEMIADSQKATGKTRKLIKMVKRWNRESNMPMKSYQIEFFSVGYLDEAYSNDLSWSQLVESFFTWLELQSDDPEFNDDALSKVTRAKNRAQKARDYELQEKYEDACAEWRKMFGTVFPVYDDELDTVKNLEKQYPSPIEEFIEHLFPVKIDPEYRLKINATVSNNKGFRNHPLSVFINKFGKLLKRMNLLFEVSSNIPHRVDYYWKVRNFYEEAKNIDAGKGLRGKIEPDSGLGKKTESTLYKGTHYIECYALVGGICVAKERRFVPIGENE